LLRKFHPPAEKASLLWQIFQQNVAPLAPILHKPTASKLIQGVCRNPEDPNKESEALILTIYLAAVISLTSEQCLSLLHVSREACVKRFVSAVELALSEAGLLQTESFVVLQAAVLYLTCMRQEDRSKFTPTMVSVVVRLAQKLGLHRDGRSFRLSIFETEMRQRLWWHIFILDVRSSEDEVMDRQIASTMFDTHFPSNYNDDDLSPGMDKAPEEHDGFTDMTFLLIRCEILTTLSQEKSSRGVYDELKSHLVKKYIDKLSPAVPLQWVCATVARLLLAKFWLLAQHPLTRYGAEGSVPNQARNQLFSVSLDVIKHAHLIEHHQSTAQWRWMFRANTQWHAVAFVLSELCVRPASRVTDQAWRLINTTLYSRDGDAGTPEGSLWQPVSRLRNRAELFQNNNLSEADGAMSFNLRSPLFSASRQRPALQGSPALDVPAAYGSHGLTMLPHAHLPNSPCALASEILQSETSSVTQQLELHKFSNRQSDNGGREKLVHAPLSGLQDIAAPEWMHGIFS
jgi:hypothetical protein